MIEYTYERQYTRNGNPMQRYQIYEKADIFENFDNSPSRVGIVFNRKDAEQIVELLNTLNGLKTYHERIEWYKQNRPEDLKEQYRK